MKRLGIVVVLVAAAGTIWYLQRRRATAAAPEPAPTSASGPATPRSPAPAASEPQRLTQVTRLASIEQRRALAERIASAQASRAATHAPPRPQLPDPGEDATPITKTELRAAMRELIPHLRDCYVAALPTLVTPDLAFTVELTLSGDPDIGTLVDAKRLIDDTGKPLPAAFDDCVRSTFQVMALPPLAEGDKLEVRYPFKFANN